MKRLFSLVLALACAAAACSDPVAPAAPAPVPPTITETFNGTLLVFGNNSHTFTVNQIGGLEVTLTGVTPGASVGLGVGTPSGATCLLIQNFTVVAGPSKQLSGTATVAGSFCVAVFDVGNLVESVDYTITVLHS